MGFVLWRDHDLVWAAGTYEYRAMGVAVVASTDLFRPSDFRRDRLAPPASSPSFAGHFASLEEINDFLQNTRRREVDIREARSRR